ncbi:MAG: hypothetical protein ACTSVV_19500 [Promethearchaeota archaeon]
MNASRYWNQNIENKDKKFYVSYCLLSSALSDQAIANELMKKNRLNWSVTSFYYSLIHALRLFCFIPFGDFPRTHVDLPKLYINGSIRINSGKRWAPRFSNRISSNNILFEKRRIIDYFYNHSFIKLIFSEYLKSWGKFLDKSRSIRVDSNYEGLIIAHEQQHQSVTGDFYSLLHILKNKVYKFLKYAIKLFKIYIEKEGRTRWYSYLNWKQEDEGIYYLKINLEWKNISKKVIDSTFNLLKPIKVNNINVNQAQQVFDHIKYGVFTEKGTLMRSFGDKIRELKNIF